MITKRQSDKESFYLDAEPEPILVHIVRSRRKTYGLLVRPTGEVEARIPLRGSVRRAREVAAQNQDWILDKCEKQKERSVERRKLEEESRSRFTDSQRQRLEKEYRRVAKEYIPKRARYYADILGVDFSSVRIAEQKTRWGSCSQRGTLSFNWKLMLAPARVLDYVIVHEVCHLKEMNHSDTFWAWVGFLMPDYKEHRKWLKEHGEQLQYY